VTAARSWRLLVILAAATLPMGCTSPNPNLYTISPVPGTPVADRPQVVMVREIALASYLERAQVVRSSENYRLDVQAGDWWGEPLRAMLNRVLVEDLSERLPGSSVYTEGGAVSARPDVTVELNIQRLDEDATGAVVMLVQTSVERTGHQPALTRSFRLTAAPTSPGVSGQVAATSRLIGELADRLAAMVGRT
jgi:uncharacterized protein